MRRLILSLPISLTLAGCAALTGTTPVGSATVTPDYAVGGGAFNTGTRVTVAADAVEHAGKVAVCAAWAADGVTAMTVPYLDTVLEIGVLQLGGNNMLQGFYDFPRVPSRGDLVGAPAQCVLTARDWRPEHAALRPEVRFGRIVLERDDEELGGVTLRFVGD